jgi:hypothetical protein
MGYYVRIVNSTARIPAANLDRAYQRMCALNHTHDHVKRGGSWGGGKQTAKWFSWMDADYPATCADALLFWNSWDLKPSTMPRVTC